MGHSPTWILLVDKPNIQRGELFSFRCRYTWPRRPLTNVANSNREGTVPFSSGKDRNLPFKTEHARSNMSIECRKQRISSFDMFGRVCLDSLECYNLRWSPRRHYQGGPSDASLGNTHLAPKLLTFPTHSLCACQSDNVYFLTTSSLHTNWRSYWATCKSNNGRLLQK